MRVGKDSELVGQKSESESSKISVSTSQRVRANAPENVGVDDWRSNPSQKNPMPKTCLKSKQRKLLKSMFLWKELKDGSGGGVLGRRKRAISTRG